MKSRARSILLAAAAVAMAAALTGCSSNEPWGAPQASPQRSMRAPVVAPSGPQSPFWWPLPDGWWPFGL